MRTKLLEASVGRDCGSLKNRRNVIHDIALQGEGNFLIAVPRTSIEVRTPTFFPELSSIWELKCLFRKLIWRKNKTATYRMKNLMA